VTPPIDDPAWASVRSDLPTTAERAYRSVEARTTAPTRPPRFTSFADLARRVRDAPPIDRGDDEPRDAVGEDRRTRDPVALAALARFASVLRDHGYGADAPDAPIAPEARPWFHLAEGGSVERREVESVVGAQAVDALLGAGWAELGDLDPTYLRLTMTVLAAGSLLTVTPRPGPGVDTVYLGPDSLALLRRAWDAGAGHRAADLGTGNGFLAAALATRFDHVVGTDLSARCVGAASLIEVLNPELAGRISIVRADVAAGLAPGTFDLVVANPPWVPEPLLGERDPVRRFAAGGPTGFELPRRFLDAAASLLAPNGRAFVSCLDIDLASGRRPLREHLPVLEGAGCAVDIHPSGMPDGDDMRGWVKNRLGRVHAARHVIVELRAQTR